MICYFICLAIFDEIKIPHFLMILTPTLMIFHLLMIDYTDYKYIFFMEPCLDV